MVSDGVGKNEEREKENMIVKKDCINFLEKPKTNRAQHVQTDLSKKSRPKLNISFIPFFVFDFWSLQATKLQKYYVIFVQFLQGKMGKMEKNWKENHATEVTEIPKDKNMG